MAIRTSSSATAGRARPPGSASARPGSRRTGAGLIRRSPLAAASSPSAPLPPTWFGVIATVAGRLRPRPQDGRDDPCQRQLGGSRGGGKSDRPSISANGRYVAFVSDASNLVNGDRNFGFSDVFVHDRRTRRTTRVSLSSAEKEANAGDPYYQAQPSISANGRFVAFGSGASNLVTGDHNGMFDAFVRDRETGKTTRVSISSAGAEGNRDSYLPSISASGRFVAFSSGAGGLVTGDHNGGFDVFVRDRRTGKTTRVSVNSAEQEAYSQDPVFGVYSQEPSISANGRYVAFYSNASNLVRADRNGVPDVFVRDRRTGRTTRVSLSSAEAEANGFSGRPSISADARFVTFVSDAANLIDGDRNRRQDIFVRGPLR